MTPPELIPGAAPLSGVPGLSEAQRQVLTRLWITSAQEFVGIYGTTEATRARLAGALGVTRTALDTLVNAAQRLIPLTRDASSAALELETLRTEYGLGAILDDSPEALDRAAALPLFESAARAPSPECVSLLDHLPPLRGQGKRGTCVAHAALGVREGLEIAAGAARDFDLSEQYVYWWCKQRDGLPGRSGTYLSLGMRCLLTSGAALESLWPYRAEPAGTEDQGPPPVSAEGGDPAFRTEQTVEFNRLDIPGMKACLAEGRPIAFSLPVFDSWFKSSAMKRWGKITMPLSGEPVRDGHALTLVGYQDDTSVPGGGYFLVRNSWQPWAWEGVVAPGYGYIPYAYIVHHANAVYSARRVTGARLHLREADGAIGHTTALIRNSPDVWLRQSADAAMVAQSPRVGQENAVYVRVFNRGPACAYGVRVEVFHAPARQSSGEPQPVGALEVAMVWPGETVLGPLMWRPPAAASIEFLARVSSAG